MFGINRKIKTRLGFKCFRRTPAVTQNSSIKSEYCWYSYRGLFYGFYEDLVPGRVIYPRYPDGHTKSIAASEAGADIRGECIHGYTTLQRALLTSSCEMFACSGPAIVIWSTEFQNSLVGVNKDLAGLSAKLIAPIIEIAFVPNEFEPRTYVDIKVMHFELVQEHIGRRAATPTALCNFIVRELGPSSATCINKIMVFDKDRKEIGSKQCASM
jgi:hypothetical protein